MLHIEQKRKELIEYLDAAKGIAGELREPSTEFLIEAALDEARAQLFPKWGQDCPR